MKHDIAYLHNRVVHIPQIEIKEVSHEHTYEPLKGYAFILAVFNNSSKCVGWILAETLGCADAKDWISKTNWRAQ